MFKKRPLVLTMLKNSFTVLPRHGQNCSLLYLYSHFLVLLTDELSRRTSERIVGSSAVVYMGVQNGSPAFPSQSLIYTDLTNGADERQSQCFSCI